MPSSSQHNVDVAGRALGIHPLGTHWPQQRLPRGTWRRGHVASTTLGSIPIAIYDPQCNFAHQWLCGTSTSMMFRRHLVGLIFDPPPQGGRCCGDAYLAQFCHAIGGTVIIEMPLSAYRRHGGNTYANNHLAGGPAPLSTRTHADRDVAPVIGQQLAMNADKFRHALGLRRFIVTLEKFGSVTVMLRVARDPTMRVGVRSLLLFLLLRVSRSVRIRAGRLALLWAIARLREFA